MCGLRHAVRFEHRRAKGFLERVHDLGRQRGAARTDEPQTLGTGPLGPRPGSVARLARTREQQLVQRRNRRIPRDAVIARHAPEGERAELRRHDDRATCRERRQRRRHQAVAEQLAAAGVGRGERVASALPNGLPAIVSFLAASIAGTAAPLNPAYKEDEFRFYLEDTSAKVLILPPEGADEARRAADGRVPILGFDVDASGTVSLTGVSARKLVAAPAVDDVALVLHSARLRGSSRASKTACFWGTWARSATGAMRATTWR